MTARETFIKHAKKRIKNFDINRFSATNPELLKAIIASINESKGKGEPEAYLVFFTGRKSVIGVGESTATAFSMFFFGEHPSQRQLIAEASAKNPLVKDIRVVAVSNMTENQYQKFIR